MSDITAKVSDGMMFSTNRKNGDYSMVTENVITSFLPEDVSGVTVVDNIVGNNNSSSFIKAEQLFSDVSFSSLTNKNNSSNICEEEIAINDDTRSEIPRFYIVEPVSMGDYCVNIPIKFYARLLNPEKFDEEDFVWLSSIDGKIGAGPRFEKRNLSPGRHAIFAMVSGNNAISSVIINVKYDGIKVVEGVGVI